MITFILLTEDNMLLKSYGHLLNFLKLHWKRGITLFLLFFTIFTVDQVGQLLWLYNVTTATGSSALLHSQTVWKQSTGYKEILALEVRKLKFPKPLQLLSAGGQPDCALFSLIPAWGLAAPRLQTLLLLGQGFRHPSWQPGPEHSPRFLCENSTQVQLICSCFCTFLQDLYYLCSCLSKSLMDARSTEQ